MTAVAQITKSEDVPQSCFFDAATLFNLPELASTAGNRLIGWDRPTPHVPELNPAYVFRKEFVRDFLAWFHEGSKDGLQIFGPTGCGKTSGVEQFFARLNLPVHRQPCSKDTDWGDMIGRPTWTESKDGKPTLSFQYGPLGNAMRFGHVYLLDEADRLKPGVSTALHPVLDQGRVAIPEMGGKILVAKPGFRVIATANSGLLGDATGMYAAVETQDLAYADRFWSMSVDYPEEQVEAQVIACILQSSPHFAQESAAALQHAKAMVHVAAKVRQQFVGNDANTNLDQRLEATLSTRVLVRWAKLQLMYRGMQNWLYHSLDIAWASRLNPVSRKAVDAFVELEFGCARSQ